MNETPKLPYKLSALILLALEDVEKVKQDSDYIYHPSEWHRPTYKGKTCRVCLGGAVMAKTLNLDRLNIYFPADTEYESSLNALDDIRVGCVANACGSYYGTYPFEQPEIQTKLSSLNAPSTVPDSLTNWPAFSAWATNIAEELAKIDL